MTSTLQALRRLKRRNEEPTRPGPSSVSTTVSTPAQDPETERLVEWLLEELPRLTTPEDPRWKELGVEDPGRSFRDLAESAYRDRDAVRSELLRLWRAFGDRREEGKRLPCQRQRLPFEGAKE